MLQMNFFIQITFNNSFSYSLLFEWEILYYNSNTPNTNNKYHISYWKTGLTGFLQIIGVPNQLPITFGTVLIQFKIILKVKNTTQQTWIYNLNFSLHMKTKPKVFNTLG